MKVTQKGLILVCVPLVFQAVLIGALFLMLKEADRIVAKEMHAKHAIAKSEQMATRFYDCGEYLIRYITTRNKKYRQLFDETVQDCPREMAYMRRLILGSPEQEKSLQLIEEMQNEILETLDQSKAESDRVAFGRFNVSTFLLQRKIINQTRQLREKWEDFIVTETRIEAETNAKRRELRIRLNYILVAAFVLNVGIAIGLGFFFGKSISNRLKILTDNTKKLAKEEELSPPIGGADEISQLDAVFHEMAGKLTRAIRKERAATENAVDVICSFDRQGKILKVNPAVEPAWGYQPEEVLDKSWSSLVHPDDRHELEAVVSKLVDDNNPVRFETRLISRDNRNLEILWSAQWSEKENSIYCVAHDITERKELERRKEDFYHMVSHDMRSPVTSMLVSTQLLLDGREGQIDEKARSRLKFIDMSATQLTGLINDLLDEAKIESGMLEMRLSDTSLNECIEQTCAIVFPVAERKGVTVNADNNDITVYADRERLIQVFTNLFSNAIKYSESDSEILVESFRKDRSVIVRVTDSGPGIPESHRAAIFEKFSQVRDSDVRRGSGVGLAVCKAIIEAHGGAIGVEEGAAGGSTFWFSIPDKENGPS